MPILSLRVFNRVSWYSGLLIRFLIEGMRSSPAIAAPVFGYDDYSRCSLKEGNGC